MIVEDSSHFCVGHPAFTARGVVLDSHSDSRETGLGCSRYSFGERKSWTLEYRRPRQGVGTCDQIVTAQSPVIRFTHMLLSCFGKLFDDSEHSQRSCPGRFPASFHL